MVVSGCYEGGVLAWNGLCFQSVATDLLSIDGNGIEMSGTFVGVQSFDNPE